jgi:peptide/nickel transport system substrate-binding protein
VTNAASRVAALLSGDVDLVDGVPTADIAQLKKNENVVISNAVRIASSICTSTATVTSPRM